MNLTLNIDEYLSKFNIFQVSDFLLKSYNDTYIDESVQPVFHVPNKLAVSEDTYLQKSELYYKTLLEDKYGTLSKLLTLITPKLDKVVKSVVSNEDGSGKSVSKAVVDEYYHSWYLIADNAYHMKGNVRAVLYIFEYLGFRDYDYSYKYDNYSFNISTGLSINTSDVDLSKVYITKLIQELLLVTESNIEVNLLILKYLDDTQFNSTSYVRTYHLLINDKYKVANNNLNLLVHPVIELNLMPNKVGEYSSPTLIDTDHSDIAYLDGPLMNKIKSKE